MGLVTAAWIAGKQGADRLPGREATGVWTAPTTPAQIDPGDGTTPLENVQIASNAFGRAFATWTAVGKREPLCAPRPRGRRAWSAPQADRRSAGRRDRARPGDRRHRPGRVRVGSGEGSTSISLAISTYGNPLSSPQPPAPPGPAPPTNPPPAPGAPGPQPSGGSAAAKAKAPGHGHHRPRRDLRRHDAGAPGRPGSSSTARASPAAPQRPPPSSAAWGSCA